VAWGAQGVYNAAPLQSARRAEDVLVTSSREGPDGPAPTQSRQRPDGPAPTQSRQRPDGPAPTQSRQRPDGPAPTQSRGEAQVGDVVPKGCLSIPRIRPEEGAIRCHDCRCRPIRRCFPKRHAPPCATSSRRATVCPRRAPIVFPIEVWIGCTVPGPRLVPWVAPYTSQRGALYLTYAGQAGALLSDLVDHLRYHTSLTAAETELAICTSARASNADYIWNGHVRLGRHPGDGRHPAHDESWHVD
jgi:hypothetical protein